MKRFLIQKLLPAVAMLLIAGTAAAQSTLAVVGGGGMTNGRLYPAQESRTIWGVVSGGISWRYYSAPRYVGAIGLDLEYIRRGFSFSPCARLHNLNEDKDYHYYTRLYNTLSLPIVWQPHIYLFKNRLRVYLEAALNLEYNISASYKYEVHDGRIVEGKYSFSLPRDNYFGYGLAGGGGLDFLAGRFEIGVRVRYYFGLGDIMRNRNKYYDNAMDDTFENPFSLTPLRSPVDNLMISLKLGFRFNKAGFTEWTMKRQKRDKKQETFNFSLD